MFKRRKLLQFAGMAVGMYSGVGHSKEMAGKPFRHHPLDPVTTVNFQKKLFVPVGSGPFGVLDVVEPVKIRATEASFPFLAKHESPFLLYQTEQAGKAYQNPIFRIERGSRFSASLTNELKEPTIIHWHGLHTPAAMDGHPSTTIGPGARYDYDFTVSNRGGTYWYHTHAHKLTAKQAYTGLASFFLVEDDDQRTLVKALDFRLGETDLPVVIQDKQFDEHDKLRYKPNAQESMMGWLGDIILANLTPNAVQAMTRRAYRLRLLNGSNSRIYRLAFLTGNKKLDFTVMGTDGGLLARPESVTQAFLAPGERLDVLFDAGHVQSGSDVFLKSLAFDAMENEGFMGGMDMGKSTSRLAMGTEFNILKLTVMASERTPVKLPATLSQVQAISQQGATSRNIDLSLVGMRFLINGLKFQMDEIAFEVKRGSVEVWNIRNPTAGMPHPMHLHGFSFQVLERLNSPSQVSTNARFGKGRTVTDLGWKDTVLVWPGETVRIAIDFTHNFSASQTYLFHCHNLEHEDAGMMINFRVQA